MKVGLAMYTVRNAFANDPMGTLEKIAAAGYKTIEVANHRADKDQGTGVNLTVAEIRNAVDRLGIKIVGAHFMAEDKNLTGAFYHDDAAVDKVIDYFSQLGSASISIPVDFFPNRDYLLRRCELYNDIGRRCYQSGMKFLYHNHYHEFQRFDGRYMMDIIMENTDPAYVGIELDSYWTLRGGTDPAAKIRAYGDRIAIIHQKDFPLEQVHHLNAWLELDQDVPLDYKGFRSVVKPEYFTEVGDGMMKIQDIIDAGNEFNVPYILLEQDYTTLEEIDSMNRSMSNFRTMRGLEWD